MTKKIMIMSLCFVIGIFFTTISFSQDDPSKTESDKVEDTSDEKKDEVKDEKKNDAAVSETSDVKSDEQGSSAKTYSDGSTIFVNSKVKFKLTSSDNIAIEKIEYKIDDGEAVTYDKPFAIEKEGSHVIKYYGIDKTDNKETEKSYSIIVDNTAPTVIVTTNKPVKKIGDKIYFSKDHIFSINANDALSGVDNVLFSINGTDYNDYATPFKIDNQSETTIKVKSVDNVSNGSEKFVFRIVDEQGNEVDMQESEIKLTTDNIGPAVEIKPDKELKKINNSKVASTDIKYTVSAKDDQSGVASVYYRIDGKGDFVPYKETVQFLTNGKHQIEAKAIDKAGNESNILNFIVYVDIIPPVTEIETVK